MSYQALARKWRPRTFSQLVGQEHVSKGLINSLNQQRLHHAYLFTGTRGVGKTSIARLLAKAMNCEQGISAEPCLQCSSCQAIEQGRFIDLIEVDAASRTGVEETRALLDNVPYATANARFKVYLIDEVHMLSQHSFNALLKTLEEPPEHVKFILATTDPQKLPATILSRCLQFHLRPLSPEQIQQHLTEVLHKEDIQFEEEGLKLIAKAAKGSMRDSLSILDQAIAVSDGTIMACNVKMLLGYSQQNYSMQILQALAEQNATKLFTLSQHITDEGGYFSYILDDLVEHLHQLALYQKLKDSSGFPEPDHELQTLALRLSPEDIQLFYQISLKGHEELRLAPTSTIGFEMTLLRMLAFRPASPATTPPLAWETNMASSEFLPAEAENTTVSEEHTKKTTDHEIHESTHNTIEQPVTEVKTENTINAAPGEDWSKILPQLKLRGLALNAAENAEFISKDQGNIQLGVNAGHLSLFTPAVTQRIENALSSFYKEKIKIKLNSEAQTQSTPAQEKQREHQHNMQQAEDKIEKDPVLQEIQSKFSAKIIKNSIEPI